MGVGALESGEGMRRFLFGLQAWLNSFSDLGFSWATLAQSDQEQLPSPLVDWVPLISISCHVYLLIVY